MALSIWALPRLSKLLPLDEDSLKQIITYTDTLPREAAAEHLKNLLGDSPQALEFIASFNSRRQTPPSEAPTRLQDTSSATEVPRARPRNEKKKPPLHSLPARQIEDHGIGSAGAYMKRDEDDYMSGRSKGRKEPPLANTLALQDKPEVLQLPTLSSGASSRKASPRPPPSASGPLISDTLEPKSQRAFRTSSPAPSKSSATKTNISGGTSMHGQSSTLNDLDSAIRALEIQTNPSLSSTTAQDNAKRRCNCMATRHPLLIAAPNCLNCGKIVCVKEGLGPCTFCERPLLAPDQIQDMVRVLREERGRERMTANNSSQKRAEVATKPRPFSGRDFLSSSAAASPVSSVPGTPASSAPPSDDEATSSKLAAATRHRDRLLDFQAQNARRTRVHDEAADFETPTAGQNMWASPQQRALQLKRQQKVLREQEWSARPEWEKRKMVVSVDLVGGKIVKKFAAADRPESPPTDEDVDEPAEYPAEQQKRSGGGAFARNPLLGALVRPTFKADGKSKASEGPDGSEGVKEAGGRTEGKKSTWRRVQDDNDDNEQWILDGGVYGGRIEGRVLGDEERAQG
ncbi:C2HC5 finger protein [Cryomyces antarcticus]